MMQVALTWDLVVIIFFVVIMSYSYIVGLNGTVKIVLSSYISMLAANGIGNLAGRYISLSQPLVKVLSDSPEENIIVFKIMIFVIVTLILVLRGSFIVDIVRRDSLVTRFIINSLFGFLSAGLIMSTVLVFLVGSGLDLSSANVVQEAFDISDRTLIVRMLIQFYNFWFAAPAVAFVILSILTPNTLPPIMEEV